MRRIALALAAAAAVGAAGVLLAAWPATLALATVTVVVIALACRSPALALAAGTAMLGFEGSIKILLGLDRSPLSGSNRAAGALAIDLVLFAGVAGVLLLDRGRTPRAIWRHAGRAERVMMGLLVAWLGVSVVQIVQGGHPVRGLEGFRLFQAYALVAVAAAVVFSVPSLARRGAAVLLSIGLAVSLYAAVRVVTGPAATEVAHATAAKGTTMYGSAVRAVGSFSSAVGLMSYLVPVALFGFVIGLLVPRLRLLGWAVTVLCAVGLSASYARTTLLGVLVALAFVVAILLAAADVPVRRKLAVLAISAAMLGGLYAAVDLASQGTPILRARAHGILHPLSDPGVKARFHTWRRNFDDVLHHPLGQGVGSIGRSAQSIDATVPTTDNSFLKVFVDQGIVVGAAFLVAVFGLAILLGTRLRRAPPERRSLGLAALAGFVGFLGLSITGETVEQPGKAVAWGLLGIALAQALAPESGRMAAAWAPSWSVAGARARIAGQGVVRRRLWVAAAVALVVLPAALTLERARTFEASVELVPRGVGPIAGVTDPAWYRRFVGGPGPTADREREMAAGITRATYRTIRIVRTPTGIRLSARLRSPDEARRFVRSVGATIAKGAEARFKTVAFVAGDPILRRLRTHLRPSDRRRLRAELAKFSAVVRGSNPPVSVGRRVVLAGPTPWADRLVDALPGESPGQPSPFWAAVAGLIVAAALWGAALVLVPPGRAVGERSPRAGLRAGAERPAAPIGA